MQKEPTDEKLTHKEGNSKKFRIDFSWVILVLCLSLFILNFWLFYPGYYGWDWANVMVYFKLDNHHPVMYPWLLKKIANAFGLHLYYPILFNLIPFYLGIYMLVLGCWRKFHSKWCLLGILPICIHNIFFSNIISHSSSSSPMFIFLLCSIVLYQVLNGITYKNMIFASVVFFLSVLSRHNALIQAYPVFFIYAWFIVQKFKTSYRFLKYIGLLFLFAIITIGIAIGIPKILKQENGVPAEHIFLHQIAGACVPNHDSSCFRTEWYRKGKNYKDVEQKYLKKPLHADHMNREWRGAPFKQENLDGLSTAWLHSIFKYPKNYIKHLGRFITKMWWNPRDIHHVSKLKKSHCLDKRSCVLLKEKYSKNEIYYKPSNIKKQIYNFAQKVFIKIPTIIFVFANYLFFIVSGILFLKKRDNLLLYILSSSIAGMFASVIFCIFSSVTDYRYIYPVLISALMSGIGLIIYFLPLIKIHKKKS